MIRFDSGPTTSLIARERLHLYLLLWALLFACSREAPAQPGPQAPASRAEQITAAEKAKAQRLRPEEPDHIEKVFVDTKDKVISRLSVPSGFHLRMGGLPTGGGFSIGPRYTRLDLLHERLVSDTSVVGSAKLWWRAQTSLAAPSLVNGHLSMKLDAAYEDAASVFFYGEGPTSSRNGKSNFRREFTTAHFEAAVHTARDRLALGYRIGGLLANVGPGRFSDPPSTSVIYTESTVPGLDRQSHFITGTGFVYLDFTKKGFSNPSGFKLQAENTQFWDKTWNAYSFDLLATQAEYDFTFANGMRTLALRARNETTLVDGHQVVPFYLQPTLGGSDDLRGYDRYRFYGNASSLVNAEYRWSVAEVLEMAVFADGGNVYQRPGLIGLRHSRGGGGIGLRFKNKDATFMRVDIGASPEGVHVWFVFNPVFRKLPRSF